MRSEDIPKFTRSANYQVNVSFTHLNEALTHHIENGLILDPDFQRGHVWTEEQQQKFVEFKLRGGDGSNVILFNCVGWMEDFRGPFVLVDGKQRIEAVTKFLGNELKVFGLLRYDFEDELRFSECDFIFKINNLRHKKEVLQWYLEINSGGTPHTEEEIKMVEKLLKQEII